MAEVVTEEQLRALCEEFGYPEPGPHTLRIAQENALSEPELRQRFIAMQLIQSSEPSVAEMEAAYERALRRRSSDAEELEWWRTEFACRFVSGNLPKVGMPLFGDRFRLQYQDRDGTWKEWEPYDNPREEQ